VPMPLLLRDQLQRDAVDLRRGHLRLVATFAQMRDRSGPAWTNLCALTLRSAILILKRTRHDPQMRDLHDGTWYLSNTGLCFRVIVAAATRSSDPPQGCPSVAKNPPSSAGTMARPDRVR